MKAAVIASSCCTLPLLLVMLFGVFGAGSMTLALSIPRYKIYFIVAGSLFLLTSLYLSISRRCGGSCSIEDINNQKKLVVVSILTYLVTTTLTLYLVLPIISTWLFGV